MHNQNLITAIAILLVLTSSSAFSQQSISEQEFKNKLSEAKKFAQSRYDVKLKSILAELKLGSEKQRKVERFLQESYQAKLELFHFLIDNEIADPESVSGRSANGRLSPILPLVSPMKISKRLLSILVVRPPEILGL